MKLFILCFGVFFFIACKRKDPLSPADRFLNFLNNYQIDSLQPILDENFQLKRTFTSYSNDKKSLIEDYLPHAKKLNAKFEILETKKDGLITIFLANDCSDYIKYLHIDRPQWKIKIISNNSGKIESMIIDTTENHYTYSAQTIKKDWQFYNWLKQKYPNETREMLLNTTGLYTKRLKEYSNENGLEE